MARNPFWAWSLRVYRKRDVLPACLALQDRSGVNVNLLLFCLWAGREGRTLRGATLNQALAVVRDWCAIIDPLRQSRRVLKASTAPDARRLRARVLQIELEAERLVQDRLHAMRLARGAGDGITLAADNVATYFGEAGIRLAPRDWAALKAVVRAAF